MEQSKFIMHSMLRKEVEFLFLIKKGKPAFMILLIWVWLKQQHSNQDQFTLIFMKILTCWHIVAWEIFTLQSILVMTVFQFGEKSSTKIYLLLCWQSQVLMILLRFSMKVIITFTSTAMKNAKDLDIYKFPNWLRLNSCQTIIWFYF